MGFDGAVGENLKSFLAKKGQEYGAFDPMRARQIYAKLKPFLPLSCFKIHVLGTNGKGSTGRFIALGLLQNHKKVLHFTSPHLFDFTERFYKNGKNVEWEELEAAHRFLAQFEFVQECSYFEYATFLALQLACDVDYLVLEAGLGGEFDSTSCLPCEVSVFSQIGLDHQEFLGGSVGEIARTKLRAMGEVAFLAPQRYAEVVEIAREIAHSRGARLFVLGEESLSGGEMERDGGGQAEKGLAGKNQVERNQAEKSQNHGDKNHAGQSDEGWSHQSPIAGKYEEILRSCKVEFLKENLCTALHVLEFLGMELPHACYELDLRGRFEAIAPNITIDVGHNIDAAHAIARQLLGRKITLIYNAYGDKNIAEILEILKPHIREILYLPVENPRIIAKEKLRQIVENLGIAFRDFDGIEARREYLVFGSFSLVERFLEICDAK